MLNKYFLTFLLSYRMKPIITIIILAGFMITSCKKDFLVVTPETNLSSATFFKTEADFKQAVNGAYVPLRNIVNGPAYLMGEMHSDNTYYFRNILFGATDASENIADFALPSSGGVTTNGNVTNQYRQDYQIIARTNQILTTIDAVDFAADSKNNLKGQAYFSVLMLTLNWYGILVKCHCTLLPLPTAHKLHYR